VKKQRTLTQSLLFLFVLYWLTAAIFYVAAGDGIYRGRFSTDMVDAKSVIPPIQAGNVLTQKFVAETDTVDQVMLYGATYARENTDILTVSILNETGELLASQKVETGTLSDNAEWPISFAPSLEDVKGQRLTLEIQSDHGSIDDGVTLYFGDSVSTARADVQLPLEQDQLLHVDGQPIAGSLCLSITGTNTYLMGSVYWYAVALGGLLLLGYGMWMLRCEKTKRHSMGLHLIVAFKKYRFLLSQLVSRDFKTKYKRSILGVFWSFLNPLLTMMVQYIVFSTLFKSSIANFPVYLLTGIIVFSYFNEVSNMSLTSITGNSSLITKVYVPKYIYPVSRALSSSINLMLSLIPLLLVLLITRTPITKAFLLLPFAIVCVFLLSLGIGLLLASLMVFFRDTQFLWGVISMVWMYATPIFYPESIIPGKFLLLYKMNPLYHIIRIFRIILINGVSPEPKAYLLCLIAAVIPFLLGAIVFKKTQDRFVLNL